jgi:excinuclease ABC subunit A
MGLPRIAAAILARASGVLDKPQALEFFENFPAIRRLLASLSEVGLGYLTLGQASTTLSGGEAQRVKLAAELARVETGRTLYLLDEPTTGLHFRDIQHLIDVLEQLVDRGNTVIVIEHHLDVIKRADWIIDVGPEGGQAGGRTVAEGTPERITTLPDNHTGACLRAVL